MWKCSLFFYYVRCWKAIKKVSLVFFDILQLPHTVISNSEKLTHPSTLCTPYTTSLWCVHTGPLPLPGRSGDALSLSRVARSHSACGCVCCGVRVSSDGECEPVYITLSCSELELEPTYCLWYSGFFKAEVGWFGLFKEWITVFVNCRYRFWVLWTQIK